MRTGQDSKHSGGGKGIGPWTVAPAVTAVDIDRRLVDEAVVKRFQSNPNPITFHGLFDNFSDGTGTDSQATFADSETEAFFHSHRFNQFDSNVGVIARHDHFNSVW